MEPVTAAMDYKGIRIKQECVQLEEHYATSLPNSIFENESDKLHVHCAFVNPNDQPNMEFVNVKPECVRDDEQREDQLCTFDEFDEAKVEPLLVHVKGEMNPEANYDVNIPDNPVDMAGSHCDTCGQHCSNAEDLIAHRYTHTWNNKFTCCICCKTANSKTQLKRHIFNVHMQIKPYQCEICHKRFIDNSHLTIHSRIHTGEKPYQCDICHKRFNRNTNLTSHKLIHVEISYTDEMPFQCNLCYESFRTTCDLANHIFIHKYGKRIQ